MRKLLQCLFIALLTSSNVFVGFAQKKGDTITVNNVKIKLLSENIISNPGFEEDFSGWTDATTSAAQLSSSNFSIIESGGVNNSKYLVGTKNESSNSAGSLGTGWKIESGKTYYFSYQVKYQDATTAAGTAEWLKVSLTNNRSSVAEPYILLSSANVNAGGEWTQNFVVFTNTQSYSYIVSRFRWLEGRFGFDDFALYEASELPNIELLQSTINEALAIYNSGSKGAVELNAAIIVAQGFLTSEVATEVQKAVTDLNQAIMVYRYANASPDAPLDMTHYIINPGFDDNTNTGWTGAGVVNYHEVEFYQKTFNMYQEIKGLPAGKYTMKAQGFERPKSNDSGTAYKNGTETIYARFYAKSSSFPEKTGAFSSLYRHTYSGAGSVNGYINTMAGAESVMTSSENNYETIVSGILLGENESLIIGAKSDFQQTGYWALFDNFRLEYEGFDINDIVAVVNDQILKAQNLLTEKMQNSMLAKLNATIQKGQEVTSANPLVSADLIDANKRLISAIDSATISITAYKDLEVAIDASIVVYADGAGNDADVLMSAISKAQTLSNNLNVSLGEIYEGTEDLNTAVFAFRLANASGVTPTVVTNTNFARGATMAFGRSKISGVTVSSLLEHGFCWSTHPYPTVYDNRTTKYFSNSGYIYRMENLEPATVYYMRAYAMTKEYAVGYGDVIKVITIPKGTITYQLNSSVTNSGENGVRIAAAMESAVNYWNNLTSIQGHHLSVNYNAGTPTAEASYGGYMQFGASASYQQTGTALHEMGHTIGVGQHSLWYGPNSPLRANGSTGTWLGERANKVVQFLDNNSTATMNGDAVHMWPYGINGAHEDTGSEFLYIGNSLITQGLGEDGLAPTGGFATPAYTFASDNDVKYYIKNEDENRGLKTSYLVEDASGRLVYKEMSASGTLSNDSAAWYFDFNPATCYYRIRNAATNKYFTYKFTGTNGITLVSKVTPAATENFQLMGARIETQITGSNDSFTAKGYWIVRPEKTLTPPCLVATTNGAVSANSFNLANTATTQRWLLLSESEVLKFDEVLSTSGIQDVEYETSYSVVSREGGISIICNDVALMGNINIYSIAGQIVKTVKITDNQLFVSLASGFYIVGNQKVIVK